MIKTKILALLVVAGFLGGCENMTMGQKGAVTGAALGTGIGRWPAAASARWSVPA